MAKQRKSKEERDQEFLEAVEQVVGYHLMDWQKPYLIEIRTKSLSGQPLDIDFDEIRRKRFS